MARYSGLTSFNKAQVWLGKKWRIIHLFSVPVAILACCHCFFIGANYFGNSQLTWVNGVMIGLLSTTLIFVLLVRSSFVWSLFSLEKLYVPAKKSSQKS